MAPNSLTVTHGDTSSVYPRYARAHIYEVKPKDPSPSVTRTPRPYQIEAIRAIRAAMLNCRRVLLQLPTGAGKTFVAATVAKGAMAKGRRVTFLVHRTELVDQTNRTFEDEGIPHGLIAVGMTMGDELVQVASVQTLARPGGGLLLVRGNAVTMGLCKGSSDLIGWRVLTITPDMVGQTVAQFVALEAKTDTGRVSLDQRNFLDVVERAGGLAVVVRSADQAVKEMKA